MSGRLERFPRTWRRLAAITATAVTALLVASTATATAAGSAPAPTTATGASTPALPSVGAEGGAQRTPVQGGLPSAGGSVRFGKIEPMCSAPIEFGYAQCMGIKLVQTSRATPGAVGYITPDAALRGPAGGYSPHALASAYGYNPSKPRRHQVVAIIDAFNNPSARFDLNTFDRKYGLPQETKRSLRIVNQRGGTKLPPKNANWAGEIALDLEAVRGVCHTCRILLVLAWNNHQLNLGKAVNRAVRMGATVISNSYGSPEQPRFAAYYRRAAKAYNHPGVIITGASGDFGWYDWDRANSNQRSGNAASFPETAPGVIAVGGTRLRLNAAGQRVAETVWNDHGHEDGANTYAPSKLASGGGCSRIFKAPAWQKHIRGYGAAGCGGKKLLNDVSALADPYTGYDVYDRVNGGWFTSGGTSLAAPLVAAMAALSGGSHGAATPQATPYANARGYGKHARWDVVNNGKIAGGNGYCGGDAPRHCGKVVFNGTNHKTHNPNTLGFGLVDCSFPARGNRNVVRINPECNAVHGFDGPSGVGTPMSLRLFDKSNPTLRVNLPRPVRLHTAQKYVIRARVAVPGAKGAGYLWRFGDGTVSHRKAAHHAYARKGTYRVIAEVSDTYFQTTVKRFKIRVGYKAQLHVKAPRRMYVGVVRAFSAKGSRDINTGGRIVSVVWHFGDGHSKGGLVAKHHYTHRGRYHVVLKVKDNAGIVTKHAFTVRVKRR